jgi:predicted aldo/keto reductase-like oxidoreductase
MMPLNVMDAHWESFAKEIVPMCIEQGIAIIGMKSFADGHIFESGSGITPEEALRYSLSLPLSTLVSGMDTIEVLHQNLQIASNFVPLTAEERDAIVAKTAPIATGGKFEPFKSSDFYEGEEGRHANNHIQKYAAAD